jgi:twitching motility protein PilT
MIEQGASDLHLCAGEPPRLRRDGDLDVLEGYRAPASDELRALLYEITPGRQREAFEASNDADFAYEVPGRARFRVNLFRERRGVGAVLRQIPTRIPTAEELELPEAVRRLALLSKGLVLVTGPTGSGKSTTLAAIIDLINRTRREHVITIEDPIEFVHPSNRCLVNQREVGSHAGSFKGALRAALREDPDVVLVGEMRDLETVAIAIETAETGHLVFGTLHTTTAPSTIERLVDQFPGDRQPQIRLMLAESLRAVIAQTLLKKEGGGRVAALEILVVTPPVANLIREGKTFQIPSAMQTGKAHGMVLLNDSLVALVQRGAVAPEEAYLKAVDKEGLVSKLKSSGLAVDLGKLS